MRPHRSPFVPCFVLAVCVLLPTSSIAGVLHVPSAEYPAIQSAIDAASPYDTVLVSAGVYNENLIMKSQITLLSMLGPRVTIVDGGGAGSVITCVDLVNPTLISGFTLRNGRASFGGGLHCQESEMTFEGNIVRDNQANAAGYGGGIYTRQCTPKMVIRSNLIIFNDGVIAGGICCNASDQSRIESNTIFGNTSVHAGGIISYNYSDITIANNIIAMNEGDSGLYVHSTSSATIVCNDVWMNMSGNYHAADMTGIDGNISVDPEFCDVLGEDFGVLESSPCLPGNHPDGSDCGLIGHRERCGVGPALGACCFGVICAIATEDDCLAEGGVYEGDNLDCSPNPCEGACCDVAGLCQVMTEIGCADAGGSYLGGATSCDPNPCLGACCFESLCLFLSEGECNQNGGIFEGFMTGCDPNPCPEAGEGGCCFGEICVLLTESDCNQNGGEYFGAGTACDPNPCPVSGADFDLVLPEGALLTRPYPNPARDRVDYSVLLQEKSSVEVDVYDVRGRLAYSLVRSQFGPGLHPLSWSLEGREGQDISSGVYYLEMRTERSRQIQRVVILR